VIWVVVTSGFQTTYEELKHWGVEFGEITEELPDYL